MRTHRLAQSKAAPAPLINILAVPKAKAWAKPSWRAVEYTSKAVGTERTEAIPPMTELAASQRAGLDVPRETRPLIIPVISA